MSSRQGDWMCAGCQYVNFQRRDSCQKCSCPKHATAADVATYGMPRTDVMLAGDWYCGSMNCGSHNYASRTSCYRCGSAKDYCGYGAGVMASAGYPSDSIPGWKTGDWICSRCSTHNYASRTECYKCKTPRDYGAM